MDLRLSEKIDPSEAIRVLNENMTSEMQVLDAYYPSRKLTDLKWLAYTVVIAGENITEALAAACNSALASDKIELMKKSKSGEALVDIKPMIKSASAVYDNGKIRISCVLASDSQSFLNPEYVVKYLRASVGILSEENLLSASYSIMRDSAYDADMNPFS